MNSFSSIEAVMHSVMNAEQPPKRAEVRIKHIKANGFKELFQKECDKLKGDSYGRTEYTEGNDQPCG